MVVVLGRRAREGQGLRQMARQEVVWVTLRRPAPCSGACAAVDRADGARAGSRFRSARRSVPAVARCRSGESRDEGRRGGLR